MKVHYKELLNKNNPLYRFAWIIISVFLVLPFFVLCYYNYPSEDDYAFAHKVASEGFCSAQIYLYLKWTGRYFSSFLLSIHPLNLGVGLYKLLSAVLLLLTIHVVFLFINTLFRLSSKTTSLILSVLITFCFLNGMPTIMQGIYWAPGAVTYHLANIFSLYAVTTVIYCCFIKGKSSAWEKTLNCFFIVAVCGCNETSMLLLDLALICMLCFYFIQERKISWEIAAYILFAIICSIAVIKAPGNAVRDATACLDPNKHGLSYTIHSSFKTSFEYLSKWILHPQMLVTSIIAILFYCGSLPVGVHQKLPKWFPLLIAIVGYLFIVGSFTTGFWSMGVIAPPRTLNVSYWLFICTWFAVLFSALSSFDFLRTFSQKNNLMLPVVLSSLLLLFVIGRSGNYRTAVRDLLTGKAYIYKKEYIERSHLMKNSGQGSCVIPGFSAFPRTVFNEDITEDPEDWWNIVYARYYGKKSIRIVFPEPYLSYTYFFDFENSESKVLENQQTITSERCFSAPNSSVLNGVDTYSATFRKAVKDLQLYDVKEVAMVHVSAQVYTVDSLADATLVFSIIDPSNSTNVIWKARDIKSSGHSQKAWVKTSFNIPVSSREFANPESVICVYLWNRGNSKVFMDDLLVSIY